LRDPFSRVHPVFWPVLWLSLRAFVRWSGRMIEEGHGFAGLHIELTWYGVIRVRTVDLSEAVADFHRHMMGAPRAEGWGPLRPAAGRVKTLLCDTSAADPSAGWGPWTVVSPGCAQAETDPWIPACAGIYGTKLPSSQKAGTDPPLAPAPLPQTGRGALPDIERP
ncbi:MAG: hypothetical protein AAFR33_09450, partial [Pseudomonadota bacterium]